MTPGILIHGNLGYTGIKSKSVLGQAVVREAIVVRVGLPAAPPI